MVTLKKTLAITLSTLVLLQPVSASAATWGKIVQNIRANEVYDDGATTARVDGNTVTIAGGAIDDEVGISSYRGDLKLDGIFNIIFKKVEMTCVRIDVGISGNYNIHMDEDTTVAEGIHASANGEGVDINLTLAGTVNGDIYADALKGASMNTTNEGTVQGVLYGSAQDGGRADIANTGAVSAMNTFAMGEGSEMTIDNSGSIGGKLEANVNDGSSVNVVNSGSMDSALITANMNTAAEMKDASADFKNTEDGKVNGKLEMSSNQHGKVTGTNDGKIKKLFGGVTSETASREFVNNGTMENIDGWANEGAHQTLINNGTVTGNMGGGTQRGTNGSTTLMNNGTVEGNLSCNAEGEGNRSTIINNGVANSMESVNARDGAEVTVTNNKEVTTRIEGWSTENATLNIVNGEEGVSGVIRVDAYGTTNVVNDGEVYGGIRGYAEGGDERAELNITNNGAVQGSILIRAKENAKSSTDNNGTIFGSFIGFASGAGSSCSFNNNGELRFGGLRTMTADDDDEDMDDEFEPDEQGDGSIIGSAENGGAVNVKNNGSANEVILTNGENGKTDFINEKEGSVGSALLKGEGGEMTVTNNGTIGSVNNEKNIEIWLNNGSVSLNNNGEIVPSTSTDAQENVLAFVKMPDGLSDEQLKQQLESLNIHAGNDPYSVLVQRVAFDEDGNETVKDYQKITYNEPIQPEQPEQPEQPMQPTQPKIEVPRREIERHEMEERRKDGAIGGVYGSPYWVKQLYLGYHSLNLRLYIGEHQALFRENLSWADNSMKHLILRVNEAAPEKLTMRFDEDVLLTLERTEFAFITLTDKNGDVLMTYGLDDLRAAYDQYGLSGEDQLVIGGIHDEVMKIGADGQMVSVE